jgi:hypothetical protein
MDNINGFKLYEEWIAPIPPSVFKNMCDTCSMRSAGDALVRAVYEGRKIESWQEFVMSLDCVDWDELWRDDVIANGWDLKVKQFKSEGL